MNKNLTLAIAMLFLIYSLNLEATETDIIKDDNLSICIADTLGIDEDEITTSTLNTLTTLDCSNMSINNLEGLEYATNLALLDLSNNNITDITPLSSLDNITNLYLQHNNITDIDSLRYLNKLSVADLSYNNIISVEPLREVRTITNLKLNDNNITEIYALGNLYQLYYLNLDNNNVSDLYALLPATKLKYLYLNHNNIEDITALANLVQLRELDLSYNKINDISRLKNLDQLNNLVLSNQTIIDNNNIVYNPLDATHTIYDINNQPITLNFYPTHEGDFQSKQSFDIPTSYNSYTTNFTGEITYSGTYIQISDLEANEYAYINEETTLSDELIIDLFDVKSSNAINIDYSLVNTSVPSVYQVTFSDSLGGSITSSLEVVDIIPTIDSNNNIIVRGYQNIDDQLTYCATEITECDLNDVITIDDSGVDYATNGIYDIYLSVTDQEGNNIIKTIKCYVILYAKTNNDVPQNLLPDYAKPDIDIPIVGRPSIELPEVSRPDIELPIVARPDIELPNVVRPDIDIPIVGRPSIELPEVSRPDIELPNVVRPDIDIPIVGRPSIELPIVDRPNFQLPDISLPIVDRPNFQLPDISLPIVDRPNIKQPDIDLPIIDNPDTLIPNIDNSTIKKEVVDIISPIKEIEHLSNTSFVLITNDIISYKDEVKESDMLGDKAVKISGNKSNGNNSTTQINNNRENKKQLMVYSSITITFTLFSSFIYIKVFK